jgi:hypothetical protein
MTSKLSDFKVPYEDRTWNCFSPNTRAGQKKFSRHWHQLQTELDTNDYYLSQLPKDLLSQVRRYSVFNVVKKPLTS